MLQFVHGGEGSNYTEDHIIAESTLIQVFRDIHLTFEKNLVLSHLTTRHGDPDMTSTFSALLAKLKETKPHVPTPGRSSKHQIADMLMKGQTMLWENVQAVQEDGEEEGEAPATLDDVTVDAL